MQTIFKPKDSFLAEISPNVAKAFVYNKDWIDNYLLGSLLEVALWWFVFLASHEKSKTTPTSFYIYSREGLFI